MIKTPYTISIKKIIPLAVAVTSGFVATNALAQSTVSKGTGSILLEEIIVTAQKREQNIQDIGISINAFTADQLKDRGIDDFNQLGTLTPGVNLNPSSGTFDPVVTIRGVGLRVVNPNVSASAAVHIDEIAMATPLYLNVPLFDLERVEILKGPQGTLFGQNTTAGAINFITKKPSHETTGYIDLSYGRFDTFDLEGAIGGSLGESVAGRIALKYTQSDGHQNHLGTQRSAGFTRVPGVIPGVPVRAADSDFGDQDKLAFRGSLIFDVTEAVQIFTSFHYFKDESDAPLTKLEGTDRLGFSTVSPDPFTVEGNERSVIDNEQWGGQIRVDWDLGFANFTSLTGYEQFDRSLFGTEGSPTRILDQDFDNESDLFSQEFRLVGSTELMEWTVGVNYAEDTVDFFKIQNSFDLLLSSSRTAYVREVESAAIFGQIDWLLSDKLTLTTGLRYLDEERTIDRSTIGLDPFGLSLSPILFPDLPIIPGPTSISAEEVTWRLGLNLQATENTLIYTSISKGYKSGGYDGSGVVTTSALAPFEGEELLAYEIGVKWDASTLPLRVNAAVFYYDYDNLQAERLVPIFDVDGNVVATDALLDNAGVAEITGVEFDLLWQPVEGLSISLGAVALDGEITEFLEPVPSVVGNDTPNTADLQANFGISYETAISSELFGRVSFDYSYLDDVFSDIDNTELLVIDGYDLINGRIEVGSENEGWTAGLWAKNLADETYFTRTSAGFANEPGTVLRNYALPRTYGIDISYSF